MKSNWIKDMLQNLGLELDMEHRKGDLKLKKAENMLAKLNEEKRSMENSYDNLKGFAKVNATISGVLIFFGFIRFSFMGLFGAIAYNALSKSFIDGRLMTMKQRIKRWDEEILSLQGAIDEMKLTGSGGESAPSGKKIVDAEIIEEYPEAQQGPEPTASFGTIKEAQEAYAMMDKLEEIIASLEVHDREVGVLFRNAYEAAAKVADLLSVNPAIESKMYLYYNHVETLHDWAVNLLELENKDVYDSLLVNVKNNARKALPILQAKIDKEYFKLVNPKIMDLEAEMEVMSKENI